MADFSSRELEIFKRDFITEILKVPNDLDQLRQALIEGLINSNNTDSPYAGTLGNAFCAALPYHVYDGEPLQGDGYAFTYDPDSPREIWFQQIEPGATPETSEAVRLTLAWLDEAIAIRANIWATKPRPITIRGFVLSE
jgi:hypothetical protein